MVTTIWAYFCKACDNHFCGVQSGKAWAALESRLACPHCGTVARKLKKPRVDVHRTTKRQADLAPYWSQSMGVGPGDPGLPGETYNAEGDLLVDGRAHRRRLMRELNYAETR